MTEAATILTVDDDPDVRNFARVALADAGFRVLEAVSGEAALRLLEEETAIDLLLTDMVMPGLNGLDLAREARRRCPEIKVLFASGYWQHIVTDLDEHDLLSKPYRQSELVTSVRRALADEAA